MLKRNEWDLGTTFKDYIGDTHNIVPVTPTTVDSEWAESSLFSIMSEEYYDPQELAALYRTKAEFQDMSTVPGGHIAVNPPYGFHPNADPHHPGRMLFNFDSVIENIDPMIGLGRYYTDAYQSHIQPRMLTLSFGIPKFKNIFSFYLGAVDSMKAIIASSGRSPVAYMTARAIVDVWATLRVIFIFPVITVAYLVITTAYKVLAGVSNPYFYSMKPTMDIYLDVASQLLNNFAVARGILEIIDIDKGATSTTDDTRLNASVKVHQSDIDELRALIPNIINEHGWINMYAIVGNYQRRRLREMRLEAKYINTAARSSASSYTANNNNLLYDPNKAIDPSTYSDSGIGKRDASLSKLSDLSNIITDAYNQATVSVDKLAANNNVEIPEAIRKFLQIQIKPVAYDDKEGINEFVELKNKVRTLKSRIYKYNRGEEEEDINVSPSTEEGLKLLRDEEDSYMGEMYSYFDAGVNDGVANVNFIVDYEGAITDTFTNSVKDIPISTMVNGISTTVRDAAFSASGGNIGGDAATSALGYLTDLASGAIDGVTFGASGLLRALTGNAHMEFPKMVGDSNADIGTHQFKIRLGGPYSNPLSLLLDIDVVLSLIMAGGLPRQVGRAAHTTPFLCSAFLPGQVSIDTGAITSITINRGIGGTQYTNEGIPTDIEIRFKIVDLAPMTSVAMPSGIFDAFTFANDEYSGMSRYIKSMSGQSFADTTHLLRKTVLRINRLYGAYASYTNPASVGIMLSQTIPGRILAAVVPDTAALSQINR